MVLCICVEQHFTLSNCSQAEYYEQHITAIRFHRLLSVVIVCKLKNGADDF